MEDSSIINAMQHIQRAKEHLEVFIPTTGDRGRKLAAKFRDRCDWMLRDFLTTPGFSDEVREAFRVEMKADVFCIDDISHKFALIPADQREPVLRMIDCILDGESFTVMEKED